MRNQDAWRALRAPFLTGLCLSLALMLLPLAALQGRGRYRHLKNGVELLAFDRRISFYMGRKSARPASGCAFASAYFCRGVLPEKLILEEIRQYGRPLWEWQETVDFME